MNRRTKALAISPDVSKAVYDRDGGKCVLCGKQGNPNAHYIPRSQSGMGIEQNIVTLCWLCHTDYDNSTLRSEYGARIREYLDFCYPNFDHNKRYYQKGLF